MKIREGFVANSSSSSFILEIDIELVDGSFVSFNGMGGTPESGRIDYFENDAIVSVSPKQLGQAASVEEMIQLLTDGVRDDNDWNEDCDGVKIFEKSDPYERQNFEFYDEDCDDDVEEFDTVDAYDFVKEIRERIKSMDDIVSIRICGEEENYCTYKQAYTYNRMTGKYAGKVHGEEFEKDGASGGEIRMPDLEECDIEYESDGE